MFGFAGWNFIGCTAGLTKDQGVNIVINMFTGPAITTKSRFEVLTEKIVWNIRNRILK